MRQYFFLTILCMVMLTLFSLPVLSQVTLWLEDVRIAGPDRPYYLVGEAFDLEVRIDTGGEDVNGIDVFLTFDEHYLQVRDQDPDDPPPVDPDPETVQPFLQGSFLGGWIINNDTHGDAPGGPGSEPHPQEPDIPGFQLDYGEANLFGSASGTGLIATLTFDVIEIAPDYHTIITFDFDVTNIRDTKVTHPGGGFSTPSTADKDISLPVLLSAFDAVSTPEGVGLRWITQTEQSNLGWNIFRSEERDGKYVKINGRLVKGAGDSITPKHYNYVDTEAVYGHTYYYYIEAVDFQGNRERSPILKVVVGKTIKRTLLTPLIPHKTALLPNFPNPFNPETWLPFQLAQDTDVEIRIYDISGQMVKVLDLGYRKSGFYFDRNTSAYWDGRDSFGEKVTSGIYFYHLEAGSFRAIRKMVLLK